MGYWKERAVEDQDRNDWARGILCEVGALEECENHDGTYFDGGGDVEEAYRLVNARITSGEIKLAAGETRRDLTDLIKAIYEENSGLDECQECARNFGPD